MKFIDLFAGLGGFHQALTKLGHECVFACEIDNQLNALYKENFGIEPALDIRNVDIARIPAHDILCAGFPCQPFSHAGNRLGFECDRWGDLFDHVLKILRVKKPNYFILENVPHLKKHNNGQTWQKIQNDLEYAQYEIRDKCFSPHEFGIPQIRRRLFIIGSLSGLADTCFPLRPTDAKPNIREMLDPNPPNARKLPNRVQRCLNVWQEFVDDFPKSEPLPSFPIWSMEFGADYPYEIETPYARGVDKLRNFKGSHGLSLAGLTDDEVLLALPSYARRKERQFPKWKIRFIDLNRKLYQTHKRWIDEWMPRILDFPQSYQKFEWNCPSEKRDIWNLVIQFRASGVRVKKPTTAPSLVAMSNTQVPIIGWEKRYMTPKECAHLQSMEDGIALPRTPTRAFTALGNAVNVALVRKIAKVLISNSEEYRHTQSGLNGTYKTYESFRPAISSSVGTISESLAISE